MRRALLLACSVLSLAAVVYADEGMWLFNHPPASAIGATYGFTPSSSWLEHVQRSSVRFNSGGSGSFVSPAGLTFTNHHIAQTCLHAISTSERDLYKTGFYAKTLADEARCPDLELNALMAIDDVTSLVNAGVTPAMTKADAGIRQRANMSQLESTCQADTGLRCDVVMLYAGAVYQMYRYKKYTDVRVVFAPEFDIAFFGGDPDNFEFPRYDLDIAFFRVYENGQPAAIDESFTWATTPLKDGDPVFVSGNPGSTDRLATLEQLHFLRDVSLPLTLEMGHRRDAVLRRWAERAPENYRRAQQTIFGIENNLKRNTVYLSSLSDSRMMDAKEAAEGALRRSAASSPGAAERDDPWADIGQAIRSERQIYLPLQLVERRSAFPGALAAYARTLVRVVAEKEKPNAGRLREYSQAGLSSLEQDLFAKTPVYKDMDEVELAEALALLKEKLPNDPVTKAVIGNRPPADVARALVAGSMLDDPLVRRRLYDGGQAAIDASTDSMIVLMRTIDEEARGYRKQYDDQVASVERIAGGRISNLRFLGSGYDVSPDATFTLRLAYGAVRGYVEDGLGTVAAKGEKVPPFTAIGGAFDRASAMGNTDPFALPRSWLDAKKSGMLDLATPLNFVATIDIIGGNSGSPVVNTAAEVVGVIFDGNIQSLPWRYEYGDSTGRAVSVDSRGILEALKHVYGATRLVEELSRP